MSKGGPASSRFEQVVQALAPYLGENMARSAVRGHREKLGLHPDLPGGELEVLIGALSPGLSVFVGREKTKEVTDGIRTALGDRR